MQIRRAVVRNFVVDYKLAEGCKRVAVEDCTQVEDDSLAVVGCRQEANCGSLVAQLVMGCASKLEVDPGWGAGNTVAAGFQIAADCYLLGMVVNLV